MLWEIEQMHIPLVDGGVYEQPHVTHELVMLCRTVRANVLGEKRKLDQVNQALRGQNGDPDSIADSELPAG
jgi:hypothetical protein